jgi:hypothetical protein
MSQKTIQYAAGRQNWRFEYSPLFIMEGYIEDGVYLHAWVTVVGVRSEEIVGDLREGVRFRLDVPLAASGEIFFYSRSKALWVRVDVNGPIGRVNFDRPIANLESYGRMDM